MTPPKQPHHSPLGLLEWTYQEGEGGLINVKKKQLTFKFISGDLKLFYTLVFSIKGAGWVGWDPYGKFHYYYHFLTTSYKKDIKLTYEMKDRIRD